MNCNFNFQSIFSSTRSQKRRNNFQDNAENVGENVVFPVLVEKVGLGESYVIVAGPFCAKSASIETSALDTLRASLKEEITAEIKGLLVESQKEILKQLKPKTGENVEKRRCNYTVE